MYLYAELTTVWASLWCIGIVLGVLMHTPNVLPKYQSFVGSAARQ